MTEQDLQTLLKWRRQVERGKPLNFTQTAYLKAKVGEKSALDFLMEVTEGLQESE